MRLKVPPHSVNAVRRVGRENDQGERGRARNYKAVRLRMVMLVNRNGG